MNLETEWVWVKRSVDGRQTEIACIRGKPDKIVKSKKGQRIDKRTEKWYCGHCDRTSLGQRPKIGDKCRGCNSIVIKSPYKDVKPRPAPLGGR